MSGTTEGQQDLEWQDPLQMALGLVGDRWTFLILREAIVYGTTRFSQFEEILKIAPSTLATRLDKLVREEILEKRTAGLTGPGSRASYHPTDRGRGLTVVLAALQQWGDTYIPPQGGPTLSIVGSTDSLPLVVGVLKDDEEPEALDEVTFVRTPNWAQAAIAVEAARKAKPPPQKKEKQ